MDKQSSAQWDYITWTSLPSPLRGALHKAGYSVLDFNNSTAEEKVNMLRSVTQASRVIEANQPIPVTKERPYFVIALEEGLNTGTIDKFPQRAFEHLEEASRFAQNQARRDRPVYIVKVAAKVEIAPPPTVVTNFDD